MPDASLAVQAANYLNARWAGFQPRTLIGLGSGLGDVCREMTVQNEASFGDVPGFSPPTVAGHAGRLRIGHWSGEPVMVMLGRMHLYEGHHVERVVHPVRTAAQLGVQNIILTNMSGGTRLDWPPPLLALIDAHRDLQEGWIPGFNGDPVDCYSGRMKSQMFDAAESAGVLLCRGVYAGLTGPNYETPSEVRALRKLGCDMVGMSTVQESRVAKELGLDCCAVSCVSNFAAGVVNHRVDHADVVDAGRRIASSLAALLGAFLRGLRETGSTTRTDPT